MTEAVTQRSSWRDLGGRKTVREREQEERRKSFSARKEKFSDVFQYQCLLAHSGVLTQRHSVNPHILSSHHHPAPCVSPSGSSANFGLNVLYCTCEHGLAVKLFPYFQALPVLHIPSTRMGFWFSQCG